uniref:immunoglobulin-like domain-containing protein n=1 Tax=Thaumasiovibrio occultus TaxID=1891184 RepID=UPI00131A9098|nr:immunoglobulin-like domain-containing protein [Thaumasiovibrio occultus]
MMNKTLLATLLASLLVTPVCAQELRRDYTLTGKVGSYLDTMQLEPYEIKVVGFEANGGGNYLSSAFDAQPSSQWRSDKQNSTSFTNAVTVTFGKTETVGRILYDRKENHSGQAEKFSIYASLSEQGDDFQLVATGSAVPHAPRLADLSFQPVHAKRIKIVFDEALDDYASAADFYFYMPSPFSTVENWFTDGTYSELRVDSLTFEQIEQVKRQIDEYQHEDDYVGVDKAPYYTYLDIAKELVVDPDKYLNDVVTIEDEKRDANNEQYTVRFSSDSLVTGFAARPHTEIELFIDAGNNPHGKVPIQFSQVAGFGQNDTFETIEVYPGYRRITVPNPLSGNNIAEGVRFGGPIYVKYPDDYNGSPIKIRIKGGQRYPIYRAGDDQAQFKQELRDYYQAYQRDPNIIGVYELEFEHLFFTDLLENGVRAFLDSDIDLDRLHTEWDEKTRVLLEFFGLPEYYIDNAKTHMAIDAGRTFIAHATHGVTFYPRTIHFNQIQQSGDSAIFFHEWTHLLEHWDFTESEVTTNVPPHVLTYRYDKVDVMTHEMTDYVYGYFSSRYELMFKQLFENVTFDVMRDSGKTMMFVQLEILHPGLWAELNQRYRQNDFPKDDREFFVTQVSEIMGFDMSSHFKRFGYINRDLVIDDVQHLEAWDKPSWYLTTFGALDYEGDGFTASPNADVSRVNRKDVFISFDESQREHLLGFEVYRDGKLVGFTHTTVFVDRAIASAADHEYEIRAVDKRLNIDTGINTAPELTAYPSRNVLIGSAFNPHDHVSAFDEQEGDLTAQITYQGHVDTTKEGRYTVTYEVVDQGGLSASTTQSIFTVFPEEVAKPDEVAKLAAITKEAEKWLAHGQGSCEAYVYTNMVEMVAMGYEVLDDPNHTHGNVFSTYLMLQLDLEDYKACATAQ